MFEYVNPDNMTYEEILALQERIGYVSKGIPKSQIDALPKMRREDLERFLGERRRQLAGEDRNSYLSQELARGEAFDNLEECKDQFIPSALLSQSIQSMHNLDCPQPLPQQRDSVFTPERRRRRDFEMEENIHENDSISNGRRANAQKDSLVQTALMRSQPMNLHPDRPRQRTDILIPAISQVQQRRQATNSYLSQMQQPLPLG